MKIGDKVNITDFGCGYSTNTHLFRLFGFKNQFDNSSVRYGIREAMEEGTGKNILANKWIFTITHKHESGIYGVKRNNIEMAIGEDGLQLAKCNLNSNIKIL